MITTTLAVLFILKLCKKAMFKTPKDIIINDYLVL